jgi:hypothetical protein
MSLAENVIYHDICGSLATTRDPGIPLRVYETFIRGSSTEPGVYMGASATVYQVRTFFDAFQCTILIVA